MQNEKNEQAVIYCKALNFNASDKRLSPVSINNQPYFIAVEVCEILNLSNPTDRLRSLDDDEKLTYVLYRSGQNREVNLVNESGLYNLIFRSNKPQAKQFRKWVTSEVLPTIRKTGRYDVTSVCSRQITTKPVVDLRSIPYATVTIYDAQVRKIVYNDVEWFSVNDLMRSIDSKTGSNQIAKKLNSQKELAKLIYIFGNTHPAWFTTHTGVQLLLCGSNKLKNNGVQFLMEGRK